jgi:hypothetical protein
MYLLASVIDSLGDQMREHYTSLHALLAACLRDNNPSIRSSALHATSALIPWLITKEDIVCTPPPAITKEKEKEEKGKNKLN